MNASVVTTPLAKVRCDALIAPVYQDAEDLPQATAELDKVLGAWIRSLLDDGEIDGSLGQWSIVHPRGIVPARRVLVIGLGKQSDLDRARVGRVAGIAARTLAKRKLLRVGAPLAGCGVNDLEAEHVAAAMVEGMATGCHSAALYKSKREDKPVRSLQLAAQKDEARGARQGAKRGHIVASAVNLARDLVNEPASHMTPRVFARRARAVAKQCALKCTVMDQRRLKAERMNALLAVGRGSAEPPRLVVLRYEGAPRSTGTLALVGKGVTFDSGGLSIKPASSMEDMKCDMAGAATVLATMQAMARLKLRVNAIGLMGLTENMPGSAGYKPGDVVRARNGKTIEILNTDAEGRVVLSDVLSYAVDQKADHIVDLATLTGACVVALGTATTGVMSNNEAWCTDVLAAARTAGERMWELPMWPEYRDQIASDIADMKNTGGRWAGAITAAKLLEEFVGDKPWVHLDIAGPAFAEKSSDHLDAGATGVGIRTLVELASSYRPARR